MNQQILKGTLAAGTIMLNLMGWLMAEQLKPAIASCNLQEVKLGTCFPPQVDRKLVAANTKFGFKLFSEILKQDSGKNVFVSPVSVAIALSMAYNGASGQTQQAMAQTLELQGMSLESINQANAALRATLENPESQVQMAIANSLWAKQGTPFQPEFIQRNQQFYEAKVTDLDFDAPTAPSVINNWVEQSTKGKINKIVDKIRADDMLFLLNAMYFKGKWTTPFDKSQTVIQSFDLLNGNEKQLPMMSQSGKYRYYENEKFQAVSLPYGKGRLSLYIFLPKQKSSLAAFFQNLNAENNSQWMTQFRIRNGSLRLPRFKMDYEIELTNALKALGMEAAFNSQANFSQMTAIPVSINQVKHKTFVEVNEEGTEAAAVTSVGVVTTAAHVTAAPFEMIVDHPFFCQIRDNQTGTILFMGAIVEPK